MSQSQITPIREPTHDQRIAIRGALDEHFDDKPGCYLDGYSDQRIADNLKVPRIFVERIREAAYGPIRIDPVIAALRTELDALRKDIAAHQKGIDTLMAKAGDIAAKIDGAAKKAA